MEVQNNQPKNIIDFLNNLEAQDYVDRVLVKLRNKKDIDVVIVIKGRDKELFYKKNIEASLYIKASALGIDMVAYDKGKIKVLGKNKETYYILVINKEDYDIINNKGESKDEE